MSDVHSGGVQSRPLFVNAEALRVDVRAPSGGGGDKYEPQTLEQAQVLLAPQVEAAAASAAAMPVSLRARGHVYVEAKLLPNYLAASYFPTELLSHLGATPVGSRSDIGEYVTKTRSKTTQTRRIVFTVPDRGLRELQRLVSEGGRTRSEDQAFAQIREFDEIALPRHQDVLRGGEGSPSGEMRTWEAVLHPLGSQLGEPIPLDEGTLSLSGTHSSMEKAVRSTATSCALSEG